MSSDGAVFAVDPGTGAVTWRWDGGYAGAPGFDDSDGVVAEGGGRLVATQTSGAARALVGLDSVTGTKVWSTQLGDASGDELLDLGDGDTAILQADLVAGVIDDADGATLWGSSSGSPPTTAAPSSNLATRSPTSSLPPPVSSPGLYQPNGGPLAVDGEIVEETTAGTVMAVSATTGKILWQHAASGSSQLSAADGLVLLTTGQGGGGADAAATTVALDSASGVLRWRMTSEADVTAYSISGALLLSEEAGLYRIDPTDGHEVWSGPATVGASPVAAAGRLVYATTDPRGSGQDTLVSLDLATGHRDWGQPFPSQDVDRPELAAAGTNVVVANDHEVTGISAKSGRQRWVVHLPPDANIDGSVPCAGGVIVQLSDQSVAVEGH